MKWLSEKWSLCKPLNNSSDVKLLKDFLVDVYGNLAMVNYPYESNFLAPLPAYPISVNNRWNSLRQKYRDSFLRRRSADT